MTRLRKKSIFILLAIFLAFVLAGCNSDASSTSGSETKSKEEITVAHKLEETVVPKNPEKVVVFDFGVLDTLDTFEVEVTGIPKENIPAYLSKYEDDQYENVGSLKEPDFEKIDEIAPDLIIISGRQSALYEQLSEIAPTIYLEIDTQNYMDSFKENVNLLAEIFGKEDVAEEKLAEIDKSIQDLNEKAAAMGGNALIILANDGKVSAYGQGSRFGLIHDVFGITPVDESIESSTHGQSISFEYIVEKDPDYLFVIDRGAVVGGESSAKQVVENELVKMTKAYQNNHIIYLDPDYWYLSGGGLVSVAEMTKQIEEAIQ